MKRLKAIGRGILRAPLGCVLMPLNLVGWTVVALVMLVRHPFTRRSQEKRLRTLAHRLGIDQGMTIRTNFTGGEMVTPQLNIRSLWQGSPNDVIQAVAATVAAEGYVRMTGPSGSMLSFWAPDGKALPPLNAMLYYRGQVLPGTDVVVPQGMTGLWFTL
jgi:hypothetical protein